MYPSELQLHKANSSDAEAPFLDLHLTVSDGFVSSNIYDKRDDFDFDIVNFPLLDGDILRAISYRVIYLSSFGLPECQVMWASWWLAFWSKVCQSVLVSWWYKLSLKLMNEVFECMYRSIIFLWCPHHLKYCFNQVLIVSVPDYCLSFYFTQQNVSCVIL